MAEPLTLVVGNNRVSLYHTHPWILWVLDQELRYPTAVSQMRESGFKQPNEEPGEWDGWIRMLHKPRTIPVWFPTGLLSRVEKILQKVRYEYKIEDARQKPEEGFPEFAKGPLADRDYQIEAVQKGLDEGQGVLDLPPRSGKTRIGMDIVAKLGHRTIWIAPTDGIIKQTLRAFDDAFGKNFAYHQVGAKELQKAQNARVVLCTAATAVRLPSLVYDTRNCLVIDEFHHGAAKSYHEIVDLCDHIYYRYGMSVGPDSKLLVRISGEVKHLSIKSLADRVGLVGEGELVVEDMEVRSFDGEGFTWSPLRKVISHAPGDKKIFKIDTAYGRHLVVTEDHSVYRVERGDRLGLGVGGPGGGTGSGRKRFSTGKRTKYKPIVTCVRTGDLRVGDFLLLEKTSGLPSLGPDKVDLSYLVTPHRKYTVGDDSLVISPQGRAPKAARFVPVQDFLFLVGFFLGDGWIADNRVTFAVEHSLLDNFLERTDSLARLLGVKPRVVGRPRGSVEVAWGSTLLCDALKTIGCHRKSNHKRIPDFAWDCGEMGLRSLLDGLFLSDGSLSAKGRSNRVYYVTTSQGLAEDIIELLKYFDVTASLHSQPPSKGGFVGGKQIIGRHRRYNVHWSPETKKGYKGSGRYPSEFAKTLSDLPVRVKNITEVESPELVYDLTVGECSNFVANGILVHNTGTHFRSGEDAMAMEALLSHTIFKISSQELLDRGYLVPTNVVYVPVECPRLQCPSSDGRVAPFLKYGIQDHDIRNQLVSYCAAYLSRLGRKVIVLVSTKSQGRRILGMIESQIPRAEGTEFNKVEFVSTDRKRKTQEQIKKAFNESDEVRVLIGTSLLGEGIDLPPADALVYARGEKAEVALTQSAYRVCTGWGEKKNALIVDFADRHNSKLIKHSNQRLETFYADPVFDVEVLSSVKFFGKWAEKVCRQNESRELCG